MNAHPSYQPKNAFLKWFEADEPQKPRYAPLLLVPVSLDRQAANVRFRLRYSEGDINTNLSLQEKLRVDFQVALPEVPDLEELSPDNYFASVIQASSFSAQTAATASLVLRRRSSSHHSRARPSFPSWKALSNPCQRISPESEA